MKTYSFIASVLIALGITTGGGAALVAQVSAADGLKSSVITFVLTLGLAVLGPALLTAAVVLHRRSDSR